MKRQKNTENVMAQILTQSTIRRYAGDLYFKRGEDYFFNNAVRNLSEDHGVIKGMVQGTYSYEVKLWIQNTDLGYNCNCPLGKEEIFCKHCVAVGLRWISEKNQSKEPKKNFKFSEEDIRVYLMKQTKETLTNMLIERTYDDGMFWDSLMLQASRADLKGFHVDAFKKSIDHVVHVRDFVHYRDIWEYAKNINQVVSHLLKAIDEGYAMEAIEIAEYFIDKVEKAIGHVDDSNGEMGEILCGLQDLHLAACEIVKPDPESLAKKLFHKELKSEFDVFRNASEIYAHILGDKGLSVYRKLAEKLWKKVLPLKPGDKNEWSSTRFRVTNIMECLAKRDNNIEKLVEIKSRNLSLAYYFWEIAEIYQKTNEYDKALEWAEKGVKAFPDRTDSRLRNFLAEAYHKRGRHDEAMVLIWKEFLENPNLDHYKKLQAHASQNKTWDVWRKKAIAFVEDEIQKEKKMPLYSDWSRNDVDFLVQIYMREQDFEKAWLQAKKKGCHKSTWLTLAKHRSENHPLDAANVYQSFVGSTLERGRNEDYEEAVEYLKLIKEWMIIAGEAVAFKQYFVKVLETYKRKRNFVKLANAARLEK